MSAVSAWLRRGGAGLCLGLWLSGSAWAAPLEDGREVTRLLHQRVDLDGLRQWSRAQGAWLPAQLPKKARVLVVHMWSVTCKPCLDEIPLYAKIVSGWRSDPRVAFLFVAEDSPTDQVARLWRGTEIPDVDPLLTSGDRLRASMRNDQDQKTWPLTLLLDSRRVVRQVYVGTLGARRSELALAIDRLLQREMEDETVGMGDRGCSPGRAKLKSGIARSPAHGE